MKRLALVACSASKLDHAAPACELYTGALFRKSWRYAARFDQRMILSAKHGLVLPETVLEPYDLALSSLPSTARKSWGGWVNRQLDDAGFKSDNTWIEFLCGRVYREAIQGRYRYAWFRADYPLEGKGIGESMQWLDAQAAA